MNKTAIQWTDMSWNPIRATRVDGLNRVPGHYCEKISPGCALCYASRMQRRFGMEEFPGNGGKPLRSVQCFLDKDRLNQPRHKRLPQKVFVCDMSDLFGDWVNNDWINQIFEVMENCPQHTFQILTKRTARMSEYISWRWGEGRIPCRNIWLGTSIEDRKRLDERAMLLAKCPAAVTFWSLEPLLEDLGNIRGYLEQGVKWVIVGGESGAKARPCNVDWVRSIVKQCREKSVPVFVKQLGADPVAHPPFAMRLKDHKGGDITEWPEDLRVREFPQ